MEKRIRAVIADADRQFVARLASYFQQHPQIQVVGAVSDGPGAVDLCAETLPDVVLLALDLPMVDGVKTTRAILDVNAQTRVLIVAATAADDYVLRAIKMGAKGCVRKLEPSEIIAQAVCRVYEGDFYISSELASLMLHEFDRLT